MTQKGDPYTKLFSTLSGVKLICCILSQLNILCSSVIKLYITKMMIRPLFTVHMLRHVFSNILDLIEAEVSIAYIKTFSNLSIVRKLFFILLQLDILCTSAVKQYCDK